MPTKKKGLRCPHCNEQRYKKDFPPKTSVSPSTGLADSWCKPCKKEYQRKYAAERRKDPRWKERQNESQKVNSITKYGIIPSEYDEILAIQGGVCAGCGRKPNPDRRLDIDHIHQSGEKKRQPYERLPMVRGLLCHLCNRVLGILKDNPQTFKNLANYLENPPAKPVITKALIQMKDYLANPPAQQVLKELKEKQEKENQPECN